MHRKLLIGLTGVKGSGKTTVAEMLVELLPDVQIRAWADALKDEVAALIQNSMGIRPSREEIEALKGEVYGPLCQGWGSYRRLQDPDYWIKVWDRQAPSQVIVPDCRYPNEVAYLKANGGVLVSIVGPSRWEGDTRSATHESERHIDELHSKATYTIFNDGSIGDLQDQVKILASIFTEAGSRVGSPA